MQYKNNTVTEIDDGQVNFKIDPDLKKRFKAFCVLKDVTIKDCLTTYIEECIKSLHKGK